MRIAKEFKDFAFKGNMVDMAVGIVIGAAFSTVVKSLVDDVLMPPLGLATRGIDFSEIAITLQEAEAETASSPAVAAVTVNIGSFINNFLTFLIVALAVFMLVKAINTARKQLEDEQIAEPAKAKPEVQLLTEIRDLMARDRGE